MRRVYVAVQQLFASPSDYDGTLEKLVSVGSFAWVLLQQRPDDVAHVARPGIGELLLAPHRHCCLQPLHVSSVERWLERTKLVQDHAQRPDVALDAVGLVFPHFGRGLVRGASLRVAQIVLDEFAHVQIAKCDFASLLQEDVGTLDVPVQNAHLVDRVQPFENTHEYGPYVVFLHSRALALGRAYLGRQVPSVRLVHHDAQRLARFVIERLFLRRHEWTVDRSQNAHLVDCVLPFFL